MGTKVAPSYANLFMAELERKFIELYPLKPHTYFRFIDDIFLIWTHSEKDLLEFVEFLNNFHKSIKFTIEYSEKEINFLDTTVYRTLGTSQLGVTFFTKETDTHSKQIHRYYEYRGYPETVLNPSLERAKNVKRDTLFKVKSQKQTPMKKRIPLVITYNPKNPDVHKIIRDSWPILQSSERCRQIFKEFLLIAYRRNNNLSKLPFNSRHPTREYKAKPYKTT